jgi:hypothetical protein
MKQRTFLKKYDIEPKEGKIEKSEHNVPFSTQNRAPSTKYYNVLQLCHHFSEKNN